MLRQLKRKERNLSTKSKILDRTKRNQASISKIMRVIKPFRYFLGVLCAVLTFLIFFSILSSLYHRIQNSICGFKCGFVVKEKGGANPLDWILVETSKIFPVDFLVFLCLVFYIFVCALYGIIKLGIRVLCFTLYEIKKECTMPQALLIMAFIIQLVLMVVLA